MRIELLWWEGCPSHPKALEELERILEEEGAQADVELVEIETDDQARAERFPGSPTVRICRPARVSRTRSPAASIACAMGGSRPPQTPTTYAKQ